MNKVSINGKELPHKIGDAVYWLYAKDTDLSVEVRKENSLVYSIAVYEDRVEYLDEDGQNIEEDKTLFWTKEEAEQWLKEHMPPKLSLKKGDFVLFIRQGALLSLDCGEVDSLAIVDEQIKYSIRTASFHSFYVSEEDLDGTVFFNREEAIKKLKELETAKSILAGEVSKS
ncbi:MAG: hypothetical protein J5956_11630 [Ruminococcus sp.]|nr:hypothetical protein [Ruminococcus sp.]